MGPLSTSGWIVGFQMKGLFLTKPLLPSRTTSLCVWSRSSSLRLVPATCNIPDVVCNKILALHIPSSKDFNYVIVWTPSNDGEFYSISAYEAVANLSHGQHNPVFKLIRKWKRSPTDLLFSSGCHPPSFVD